MARLSPSMRCISALVLLVALHVPAVTPYLLSGTVDMDSISLAHLQPDVLPGSPTLAHPVGSFMFTEIATRVAQQAAQVVAELNASSTSGRRVGGAQWAPLESAALATGGTVFTASVSPLFLGDSSAVAYLQQRSANLSLFEDEDAIRDFMRSKQFREDLTPASCRELVASARVTVPIYFDVFETILAQVVLQDTPPKMWHAAITLCDADYEIESAQLAGLSTASLSYRIMFANDGGFFSQQISADAHGIIETHIAVLCVVGATFLYVLFVSARSKCWREEPSALVTPKHQRRVGKSARSLVTARAVEAAASGRFRWLRTKAAFWSVIACLMLLAVSSVFSLVYWCTIAEHGYADPTLSTTGNVVYSLQATCALGLIIAVAHGWGISHKAVLSKPTIVGICGVGALMVLSHAALLLWEPLTGDVTSFDVVLASWPGVAVAAAYTVAFATFLVATRSQHKGLGKVIALLDAKRVSTDADDMIAVAIAGADADGQEALDSAVAFVAQRRRMLVLLVCIVASWFAAIAASWLAAFFADEWLELRVAVIMSRACTVLFLVGVGFILEPRVRAGAISLESTRFGGNGSSRRHPHHRGDYYSDDEDTPGSPRGGGCCACTCWQRCAQRAEMTRRRAAMLKRQGEAPPEAPVQHIPPEQQAAFSAPSFNRLQLSMGTINSSGAIGSSRNLDSFDSPGQARLARHTSRSSRASRMVRHNTGASKRHGGGHKKRRKKKKKKRSRRDDYDSAEDDYLSDGSMGSQQRPPADYDEDDPSFYMDSAGTSSKFGSNGLATGVAAAGGATGSGSAAAANAAVGLAAARGLRVSGGPAPASARGMSGRKATGGAAAAPAPAPAPNPFAVNGSSRDLKEFGSFGMRSLSAGEMGMGRLAATPENDDAEILRHQRSRSHSASGGQRSAASAALPTAFGLSQRRQGGDFDVQGFLQRYASNANNNAQAGGSGGAGGVLGRQPTRHTFQASSGVPHGKDGAQRAPSFT